MKVKKSFILLLMGAILASLLVGAGAAEEAQTLSPQTIVTQPCYVIQEFSVYPTSLMPGDSGTVTAVLKNTGTSAMPIREISIKESDGVKSTTIPYVNSIGAVGPGDTITLTTSITALEKTGTFYPVFYVDFNYDYYTNIIYTYLKHPFAITVDDKSVAISVTKRPDVFDPATTSSLGLTLGNLRTNTIEAVQVSVSGVGVSSDQGNVFVGEITPGSSKPANITVSTTDETKEIIVNVNYRNGANWHSETLSIPVAGGDSRTGADIVINNIEVKSGASYMTIQGDVNNAGLTTAKGLVVSTEGVTATQPYSSYVVGSLDADGLSEFEVTFVPPGTDHVTVVFNYKDDNGNIYTHKENIQITSAVSSGTQGGSSSGSSTAATVVVIVIIIIVAGAVFVAWKKGRLFAKKEQK